MKNYRINTLICIVFILAMFIFNYSLNHTLNMTKQEKDIIENIDHDFLNNYSYTLDNIDNEFVIKPETYYEAKNYKLKRMDNLFDLYNFKMTTKEKTNEPFVILGNNYKNLFNKEYLEFEFITESNEKITKSFKVYGLIDKNQLNVRSFYQIDNDIFVSDFNSDGIKLYNGTYNYKIARNDLEFNKIDINPLNRFINRLNDNNLSKNLFNSFSYIMLGIMILLTIYYFFKNKKMIFIIINIISYSLINIIFNINFLMIIPYLLNISLLIYYIIRRIINDRSKKFN